MCCRHVLSDTHEQPLINLATYFPMTVITVSAMAPLPHEMAVYFLAVKATDTATYVKQMVREDIPHASPLRFSELDPQPWLEVGSSEAAVAGLGLWRT